MLKRALEAASPEKEKEKEADDSASASPSPPSKRQAASRHGRASSSGDGGVVSSDVQASSSGVVSSDVHAALVHAFVDPIDQIFTEAVSKAIFTRVIKDVRTVLPHTISHDAHEAGVVLARDTFEHLLRKHFTEGMCNETKDRWGDFYRRYVTNEEHVRKPGRPA